MSTSSTPLPCLLKHKICLEDCFPECEAPKDCNECVQPDPCSEEFPCCDGFFCCFSIGRGRYSYMQSTGRHRGRRVLRYHVLRDDAHAVSNVTLDPDRPGRCCFLDNDCGGVVTDPAIIRWGWTSGVDRPRASTPWRARAACRTRWMIMKEESEFLTDTFEFSLLARKEVSQALTYAANFFLPFSSNPPSPSLPPSSWFFPRRTAPTLDADY